MIDMENNFTQKSMEAISEAHNFAIRYKHSDMKVEHLLLHYDGGYPAYPDHRHCHALCCTHGCEQAESTLGLRQAVRTC